MAPYRQGKLPMVSVSLCGSPNYKPVIRPQAYQQAHLHLAPKFVLALTVLKNS
jgi:hypothetical protein